MHVQEMISSHPRARGQLSDLLVQCIEECYDCAQKLYGLCRCLPRRTGRHHVDSVHQA